MSAIKRARLVNTIDTVESRLEKGWVWLEDKENRDKPNYRTASDTWHSLLKDYEAACDELQEMDQCAHQSPLSATSLIK